MDPTAVGALATVVAAVVAGLTARATAKASASSAVKTAKVTSLADLEKEAGKRAAEIYEGAITQLKADRADDRAEIAELHRERTVDRAELESLRSANSAQAVKIQDLERGLHECRTLCRRLAGTSDPDAS